MKHSQFQHLVDEPTTFFSDLEPLPVLNAEVHDFPFSLGEAIRNFELIRRLPSSYFEDIREIRGRAREFADRHIRPVAGEIDRRVTAEPDYFDWGMMRRACWDS